MIAAKRSSSEDIASVAGGVGGSSSSSSQGSSSIFLRALKGTGITYTAQSACSLTTTGTQSSSSPPSLDISTDVVMPVNAPPNSSSNGKEQPATSSHAHHQQLFLEQFQAVNQFLGKQTSGSNSRQFGTVYDCERRIKAVSTRFEQEADRLVAQVDRFYADRHTKQMDSMRRNRRAAKQMEAVGLELKARLDAAEAQQRELAKTEKKCQATISGRMDKITTALEEVQALVNVQTAMDSLSLDCEDW